MLSFPTESVVQREVARNLPGILREHREILVVDGRSSGLIETLALDGRAVLQEEEQRSAKEGAAVRTGGAVIREEGMVHKRAGSAFRHGGSIGHIVHETDAVIEEIKAFEKAFKDLGIIAVQPFPAKLESVLALNDGNIVAKVGAPE